MRKANSKKILIYVIEQIATLDPLLLGRQVWMSERRDSGVTFEQSQSPRSQLYCINSNGRDAKK